MSHGCIGCTHVKRYHSDLIGKGAVLGSNTEVANTSGAEAAGDQIQRLFLQTFQILYHSWKPHLLVLHEDISGWLLWTVRALNTG
ncbi:hypothetical protein MVEN_02335800 [Mycena venus]|uniref:Uncharacterized protein n=1 Tax=Mycena venus TaxID=2733690 RepID=A0A8H7CE22_9AGAR|nr:hypothetical protein MVEN_02335800 [Mycena venus]